MMKFSFFTTKTKLYVLHGHVFIMSLTRFIKVFAIFMADVKYSIYSVFINHSAIVLALEITIFNTPLFICLYVYVNCI